MPRYVATPQGLGLLRDDGAVDVIDRDARGLDEVLLAGVDPDELASRPVLQSIPPDEVRLRAPVARPSKVWAVGYAYAEHSAEVGRADAPDEPPVLFLKAPSSLTGPHDAIELPELAPTQVDYEGEIAVVVGRRAKDIAAEDAWAYIFGVTAANDVSARDVQKGLFNGGKSDPSKAKSFDTFTPLGPCVTTVDEFDDPDDIGLTTHVDGELRQQVRSSALKNSIPQIIAFASRLTSLEPGDVVLTGTPAGVGHPQGRFLSAGSVVRIEVEGVGAIENTVRGS